MALDRNQKDDLKCLEGRQLYLLKVIHTDKNQTTLK